MRITKCDICGREIDDEHFIFNRTYKYIVPSFNRIRKYDICTDCGVEIIDLVKERRADEPNTKRD